MALAENVFAVKQRIAEAEARAGRDASEARILYATKYADAGKIAELLEAEKGRVLIGENRVQDAEKKFEELRELVGEASFARLEKHLIGSLQSNKIRQALEAFDAIHAVDSLKLAAGLNARAEQAGNAVPVFIEVNAGLEETKRGFSFDEVEEAVAEVRKMKSLRVLGLMTLAPLAGPEVTRPVFRRLKEKCAKLGLLASMGMSNDFEVAIEEGSDLVRIGSLVLR